MSLSASLKIVRGTCRRRETSLHLFLSAYPIQGRDWARAYPSCHMERARVHPEEVYHKAKTSHSPIHTYRQFRITSQPNVLSLPGRKKVFVMKLT